MARNRRVLPQYAWPQHATDPFHLSEADLRSMWLDIKDMLEAAVEANIGAQGGSDADKLQQSTERPALYQVSCL